MSMPLCKYLGSVLLTTTLLAGCGGERGPEDSSTQTPQPPVDTTATAQGLWVGTTSTGRDVVGLVVDDGSYFMLYTPIGSADSIGGVILGSGSTSNNNFVSSDARDFNFESSVLANATITATADTKNTFSGSIVYRGTTVSFSTRYDSSYENTATLSSISGSYTGDAGIAGGVRDSSLTVSASGALEGDVGSCPFIGTVTPRSGSNAYNVSLTFATTEICTFSGQQFSGLAYHTGATNVFHLVLPNAARSDVALFVMNRAGT